jgi:hypothetical protein
MPVFMQNIAAFSPPRDQPNLKFEVFDTTTSPRGGGDERSARPRSEGPVVAA